MKKYLSEFIGTFVLIFIGTSAIILGKGDILAVGLAFGLSVTTMAYAVGGISGGHFNPAVTLGMVLNGRLGAKDGIFYVIAQFLGAIVGSAVLTIYVKGLGLKSDALGQTDFVKISAGSAFLLEMIVTFLFVLSILLVTSEKFGNASLAPLAIGLTLAIMIIASGNVTGGSLNPARSFGPAIFAGGTALSHYWVYLLAPLVGSAIAAVVARFLGSEKTV